jgi:hypothetical protein
MTIPFERTRSLIMTREFLLQLQDPKQTPRVPRSVRSHAAALLKHYPTYADVEQAHRAVPETYGPVPPFSRLSGSGDVRGVLDAMGAPDEGQ